MNIFVIFEYIQIYKYTLHTGEGLLLAETQTHKERTENHVSNIGFESHAQLHENSTLYCNSWQCFVGKDHNDMWGKKRRKKA